MRLLPFEYAVRNLTRSPLRLILSVTGSMLVVLLIITAAAFVRGMEKSLLSSGSENNVILLNAGSAESIERSEITPAVEGMVSASVKGIKSSLGTRYVSPEVHIAMIISEEQVNEQEKKSESKAVIRGVTSTALLVHDQVRITEGRAPRPGEDEIMVGKLTTARLGWDPQSLTPGNTIWFANRQWTIVGSFTAPGTVMDAEIWCPMTDLQVATKRESISCAVLTLDAGEFADVDMFAAARLDLELVAMPETEYYKNLVMFYKPVRLMIWVTAFLIAMGGLFGGLNTMYAAFAGRFREIGMLQTLGYSRRAVFTSMLQESVLISTAGALPALFLGLILLDGLAVKISMGAFSLIVDATATATGLAGGIILGIIGATPPIINCMRMPIAEELKAT